MKKILGVLINVSILFLVQNNFAGWHTGIIDPVSGLGWYTAIAEAVTISSTVTILYGQAFSHIWAAPTVALYPYVTIYAGATATYPQELRIRNLTAYLLNRSNKLI